MSSRYNYITKKPSIEITCRSHSRELQGRLDMPRSSKMNENVL